MTAAVVIGLVTAMCLGALLGGFWQWRKDREEIEEYLRGLDYQHALRHGLDEDEVRQYVQRQAMFRRLERDMGEPEVTS